jgi:hypothetical protein
MLSGDVPPWHPWSTKAGPPPAPPRPQTVALCVLAFIAMVFLFVGQTAVLPSVLAGRELQGLFGVEPSLPILLLPTLNL